LNLINKKSLTKGYGAHQKKHHTPQEVLLDKLIARHLRHLHVKAPEKKFVVSGSQNFPIYAYNCTIGGASPGPWQNTILPLSPYTAYCAIAQGAGDSGRVGNKIRIVKAVFRGSFAPLPYNATTNTAPTPATVRMVMFYDKESSPNLPAPGADFVKISGSSQALFSDCRDNSCYFNTERWPILHDSSHKVGYAYAEGTGLNANNEAFTNNDFSFMQRFEIDVTKHMPSEYVFSDNSTIPTTRGLFVAFIANSAVLGTTTATQGYCQLLDYSIMIEYEDV
jgi:hypothetical protein